MYQTRLNNGKKRAPKHRVLFEPDEHGQMYAVVKDMMGNGRVRVLCEDDQLRLGRIRGAMRKCGHKVLIERGDLVIIALRDFEADKVDIVHKYNYDEGTILTKDNALPETIRRAWMNSMDVGGASSAADIANDKYIIFGEEKETVVCHGHSDTKATRATPTATAPELHTEDVDKLIDYLRL